jgi:hypothetical protein
MMVAGRRALTVISAAALLVGGTAAGCGSSSSRERTRNPPDGAGATTTKSAKPVPMSKSEVLARSKTVRAFVGSRHHDTRLIAETRAGLRDVVYVKKTAGEVCVYVESGVAGRETQTGECGSQKAEQRTFVVKGEKDTGAILNIAGYSNCQQRVVAATATTATGTGRSCVMSPFPYRLVILPSSAHVRLANAGPLQSLQLRRFTCASGACVLDIAPNGAPG